MDYALRDFLMFTPEVYLRLFVRLNETLGPWLLLVGAAGLAVALLLGSRRSMARRVAVVIAAGGWVLTVALFMVPLYAPINWPVTGFAWAFAAQALLLLIATLRASLVRVGTLPLALALMALAILASMTAFSAGTWTAVALPGTSSDITATATTLLVWGFPKVWRRVLLVIPLAWSLFSVLTHWALDLWLPMVVPIVGLAVALIAVCRPDRQRRARSWL